jgi:SNF2 family DNA or RNA helicase
MEPGLGKSRVALDAGSGVRMLVVAPPNPVELVWPEQAALWAPDRSFRLVRGTPKEREAILWNERPDIAVLNHTMLYWFYDVIARRQRLPYELLVLDESTFAKNPDSVAFRVLSALEEAFDGVIPMTGTPAENALIDLWGQLYFVDRGETLGPKVGVFREWYCRPERTENYVRWKVNRPEALRRDAAPLCFVRRADDCLDMPPLVFNDVRFRLGSKERRFFESVRKKKVVPLDDPIICANTGVAIDKMRQISSGFVYDEERNTHTLGMAKFDAFYECFEEAHGEPMFVGYWFSAAMRSIVSGMKFLYDVDIPVINGDTRPRDKKDLLARWTRGELPILLGQIQTISMGPNMQSPHASILFYDLPWSHGQHWQFIRRVWRYGQATRVVVRRLIGIDTKDSYVASVLRRKQVDEDEFMQTVLNEEII